MAENNIPNPPALGQDLDYDGDAAYRTYLNSVAPPVPLGQLQEFCPAEIPMRASLLRGDSALMKTFLSRGFLLSSISVQLFPSRSSNSFVRYPLFSSWNRIGLTFLLIG